MSLKHCNSSLGCKWSVQWRTHQLKQWRAVGCGAAKCWRPIEAVKTSWRMVVSDECWRPLKEWVAQRRRWGQWRRWMMVTNRRKEGAAPQWRRLLVWRFGREVEKFHFDYVRRRNMKNCQVVKWTEMETWSEFVFEVSLVDVVEVVEVDAYVGRKFLIIVYPEI